MKKLLLGIAAIVVIGCMVFLVTRPKPQQAADYVVKVGVIPIMPSRLPFEIAVEQGFFKKAGVQVQMTELQSSNLVHEALVRGDLDVTPEVSILPFLATELIDPGKLKIFSVTDLSIEDPFDAIVVKPGSNIETIQSLAGKKIGVFPGTTGINMLKHLFQGKGIDVSSIQFIQLPPPQQRAALEAGAIDALHVYEPLLSTAQTDGTIKKIYGSVFAELVSHTPLGAGFLGTKFVQDHPREVAATVAALNEAYDYIRTHETEARSMAGRSFSLKPEVASVVAMPYFFHSGQIDRANVNKLLDLFVTSGELKSRPELSGTYY